jgi:hypothetical protein
MGNNLTGQLISATYEQLVQISGSILTDGTGSNITSLDVTASNAVNALSANSASVATSASFADTSISASFATTASFALNAGAIDSGSFMITGSVSSNTLTFEKGDGSTFNLTVNTGSAVTTNTGSLMVTGSATLNTLTFTKGDGSTFNLTVDTGSAVTINTGSLLVTASISDATITFTKGDATTFDITVNNVSNASTASIATSATSATTASAVNTTPASDGTAYDLVFVASQAAGTQVVRTDDNGNITFNPSTGILAVPTVSGNATTATSASHAVTADTASFLPSTTNLNITSITASGGNFVNLTAVSASFGHVTTVTGSAVIIGDEFIILNADTPAARYAGLIVFDSGSGSPATASFEWDGLTDNWIIMEETGNTAVVLTGPTGSRGTEVLPTTNVLQKGGGHHQLVDSSITDNGTKVSINSNTEITGSLNVSGGASGSFSGSFQGDGSGLTGVIATAFPFTGSARITGSLIITGSQNMLSTNPLTGNRIVDIQLGNNPTTAVPQRFVVRSRNPNNRTTSVSDANMVWGGDGNITLTGFNTVALGIGTVNSNANNAAILGTNTFTSTIGDTNLSLIAGTENCTAVTLQRGAIIATDGSYGQGFNTAVIGGKNHWMFNLDGPNQVDRSVILGGNGITASLSDTVYVPDLVVTGSIQGYKNRPINISGSIINITGSTNITGSLTVRGDYNRLSGSFSGSLIDNITDVYTSTAAIEHVISLTQAEYNAISSSADSNTLYYITDAPAPITPTPTLQEVTVAGAITDQIVSFTDSTTGNNIIGPTFVSINSVDDTSLAEFSFTDSNGVSFSGVRFDPATFALDVFTHNNAPISLESPTQVTGSLRGEVNALSISSNTASLDLATGNFYTLTLVSGSNTFINPSNIEPGQTINLRVKQPSPGFGTVSFPSSVKQVSGSAYVPTAASSTEDIVTFISFDASNLYLSNVKNLV